MSHDLKDIAEITQKKRALMSHPILRIKLDALTHMCPGINHTHKLTNYKEYHYSVSYITIIT